MTFQPRRLSFDLMASEDELETDTKSSRPSDILDKPQRRFHDRMRELNEERHRLDELTSHVADGWTISDPYDVELSYSIHAKTQLNPNERQIRLLEYCDGYKNPLEEYRFLVYPVDEAPPYIALSYVWGPIEKPQEQVQIDGIPKAVHENLWEALQMISRNIHRIRKAAKLDSSNGPAANLCLWIDALCIDQDNPMERGQQVAMMDEIYKRASLVLVWLGTAQDEFALASRGIPPYPLSPIRHHFTALPDWEKNTHRSSILTILSRPYWQRLWIVQEFLLAKEVLLFYGDHHFWGQDLFRTLEELDQDPIHRHFHRHTNASKLIYAKFSGNVDAFRTFSRSESSLRILRNLILEWKSQKCHDVRDKIYAFLGLAQHMSATDDDVMVRPDYKKSSEQVFADFVRFQIYIERRGLFAATDDPGRLEGECRIIGMYGLGLSEKHSIVKAALQSLEEYSLWRYTQVQRPNRLGVSNLTGTDDWLNRLLDLSA